MRLYNNPEPTTIPNPQPETKPEPIVEPQTPQKDDPWDVPEPKVVPPMKG